MQVSGHRAQLGLSQPPKVPGGHRQANRLAPREERKGSSVIRAEVRKPVGSGRAALSVGSSGERISSLEFYTAIL